MDLGNYFSKMEVTILDLLLMVLPMVKVGSFLQKVVIMKVKSDTTLPKDRELLLIRLSIIHTKVNG